MTSQREIDFGQEKVSVYEDEHGDVTYFEEPVLVESFRLKIRKVELGKPGNFEIFFDWSSCVFRLHNLGEGRYYQPGLLIAYLIIFSAAFRGELAAMVFLPFTILTLHTSRSSTETPTKAATQFLNILDPLRINMDVFAIGNMVLGLLSAACIVIFHLSNIWDFFMTNDHVCTQSQIYDQGVGIACLLRQTLESSFSAVSKPNFASKY